MSSTVWAIGSIGYDLFGRAPHLPRPGETVAGSAFLTAPGGKGLNQAVAAARMGAKVAMAGAVGADSFGHEVMAFLQSEGVELSRVKSVTDTPTGTALIFVAQSGENSIIVVPGANGTVTPAEIEALPLAAGDIVQTQFEIPLASTLAALRHAKAKGALSILNPSPMIEGARDALALASLIVLNEVELGLYSGTTVSADAPYDDVAAVARRLRSNPQQIIITTLGPRGAVAVLENADIIIPGHKVTAVDTTGAGDTFAGTLAAFLASGHDLAASMRAANSAAALSVGKPGAAPSIPHLNELPQESAA